ncbi:MAG: polysaccharide deacetylase family protein [Halodesulfurarchaeum sp.]|nr:polysaccharide deacetylase family protein [Halodesulfurarchaeum sp.]
MTDPPEAVLSVDFELFSHTPAYRQATGSTPNGSIGIDGGEFLRAQLSEHDVSSTFFVVSSVGETHPGVIENLAADGHEIGSHTHTHRLLTELDPSTRLEELERSKETLEALTGTTVTGFRAPAFDFGADHFDMLGAASYEYDSSVVASRAIPGWYGGEYTLQKPAPATAVEADAPSSVAELPVSVMPGIRLPLTGTWLRFFGPGYTILGMKLLARQGVTPVLYVHPWEFVDLPTIKGVPRRVYWHTGQWMRRAVQRILDADFAFITAQDALQDGGVRAVDGSAEGSKRGER